MMAVGTLFFVALFSATASAQELDELEQQCEAGDVVACRQLGARYKRGIGVSKDEKHALTLFERACDRGDASACFQAGIILSRGDEVTPNPTEAFRRVKAGCDGGITAACSMLGKMYEKGEGVQPDVRRAAEIYQQGCDGEHAISCYYMGLLYMGVDSVLGQDLSKALGYFQRGCNFSPPQFTASCEVAESTQEFIASRGQNNPRLASTPRPEDVLSHTKVRELYVRPELSDNLWNVYRTTRHFYVYRNNTDIKLQIAHGGTRFGFWDEFSRRTSQAGEDDPIQISYTNKDYQTRREFLTYIDTSKHVELLEDYHQLSVGVYCDNPSPIETYLPTALKSTGISNWSQLYVNTPEQRTNRELIMAQRLTISVGFIMSTVACILEDSPYQYAPELLRSTIQDALSQDGSMDVSWSSLTTTFELIALPRETPAFLIELFAEYAENEDLLSFFVDYFNKMGQFIRAGNALAELKNDLGDLEHLDRVDAFNDAVFRASQEGVGAYAEDLVQVTVWDEAHQAPTTWGEYYYEPNEKELRGGNTVYYTHRNIDFRAEAMWFNRNQTWYYYGTLELHSAITKDFSFNKERRYFRPSIGVSYEARQLIAAEVSLRTLAGSARFLDIGFSQVLFDIEGGRGVSEFSAYPGSRAIILRLGADGGHQKLDDAGGQYFVPASFLNAHVTMRIYPATPLVFAYDEQVVDDRPVVMIGFDMWSPVVSLLRAESTRRRRVARSK